MYIKQISYGIYIMYSNILSDIEKQSLSKYKKVIVWGFPIDTHTHSYIHAMWIKVFSIGFGKKLIGFMIKNILPILIIIILFL